MRPKIITKLPGPKSSTVVDCINNSCYFSTFTYPLVIKGGQGCFVFDLDNNVFLDFTSNISSCPLGYAHPDLKDVFNKDIQNANKIAGQDFYCEEHAILAKKLADILPDEFKFFFVNSGAEAVENSIKIAYSIMGPLPGVSCLNGFHGRTIGALSFTLSKEYHKYNFPELPVKRIKFCTNNSDIEIDKVERILENNKISFIIVEPIQGEGGINVASKKFMSTLRKITLEFDVPLIVDEVQTGLARTGKWWGYEHYDIVPDIVSIAKALQVGATAFKKRYLPKSKGLLSSTWGGGDRIDMALGSKIIDIVKADNLMLNVQKNGIHLKKRLTEYINRYNIIDVRGIGLMLGVEFSNEKLRDDVLNTAFQNGLLLLPSGKKSIRIMPPLIITKEEIDIGLEIFENILRKTIP